MIRSRKNKPIFSSSMRSVIKSACESVLSNSAWNAFLASCSKSKSLKAVFVANSQTDGRSMKCSRHSIFSTSGMAPNDPPACIKEFDNSAARFPVTKEWIEKYPSRLVASSLASCPTRCSIAVAPAPVARV